MSLEFFLNFVIIPINFKCECILSTLAAASAFSASSAALVAALAALLTAARVLSSLVLAAKAASDFF